jgi:hypothetical protein
MLPRCLAALCLPIAALIVPSTASAGVFKDRVVPNRAVAHAARSAGNTARYPTGDGGTIPVTAANPTIAQQYATFVGTLPHGTELQFLHIIVVPAARVNHECGGSPGDGILACYGDSDQTMIVPDAQATNSDVSVNYVIAHEYGHHIAAHRSNAPLSALDFGPKRWSSYELVCENTIRGRLAPGDEGVDYLSNPGEAWAEAYARLVFPTEAWRFTSVLKPTSGSLLAAMADVAQPWKQPVSTVFTGSGTKTFSLPLTLDGAFTLQLSGPRRAQYDIVVRSGGKVEARTSSVGSADRIHYRIACRGRRTENLAITVIRRSGGTGGAYSLKASYAG